MATEQQEAKRKLRQLLQNVDILPLTEENCELIITSGGPTFKPAGKGFRCNQTGEFVGKKTQSYARRIFGDSTKRNKRVDKEEGKEYVGEHLPAAIEISQGIFLSPAIYCPRCQIYQGEKNHFINIGTCTNCNQKFRV